MILGAGGLVGPFIMLAPEKGKHSEGVNKLVSIVLGPFRMALFPDRHVPRKPRLEGGGKGHNIEAYHLTGKPGLLRPGASLWKAGHHRLGNPSRQ